MSRLLAFMLLFVALRHQTLAAAPNKSPNQIMRKLLDKYDKSLAPGGGRLQPTDVTINFHIISVQLDEPRAEMTVDMYFRLKWDDERMKLGEDLIDVPSVPQQFHKKLWQPDIVFSNGKIEDFTKPVAHSMMRISGTRILYSRRLRGVFKCSFDYRKYPADVQQCEMNLESYGHTLADLNMSFKKPKAVSMSESSIRSTDRPISSEIQTKNLVEHLSTGSYQRLTVALRFGAPTSYIMRHTIIPYIVFIILSYISFFVGRKYPLIRFGYLALVGILLSLSVLNANSLLYHPQVLYMTYVDIYLTFASVMYTAAILHFVVALRLTPSSDLEKAVTRTQTDIGRLCDIAGMLWYPLVFIVFNIIFFALLFT